MEEEKTNICGNCNNENDLNSKYCEYCGSKLGERAKENACLNCGTLNKINSKFCKNCGNELNHVSIDNNDLNQKNPSFDNLKLVSCPYCSSNIPMNSLKCRNCGEWIDNEKSPSQYTGLIILGYIFTFLGGIIGLIIAIYLFTRDNERARRNGKYMLIISLIFVLMFGFVFLSYLLFSAISSSIS